MILLSPLPGRLKKTKLITIAELLQLKHLRSLGSIFSAGEEEKTGGSAEGALQGHIEGADPEDPEMCAPFWAARRRL